VLYIINTVPHHPTSGIRKEPLNFTKGYGLQLAAILRDIVNVNETNL
jgi:hypothetical protein